jgi:hypothetical protein
MHLCGSTECGKMGSGDAGRCMKLGQGDLDFMWLTSIGKLTLVSSVDV